MSMFFIVMIILILLVLVGFTILIAFVIKKSTTPKTKEFIENERNTMRQNVLKERKKLAAHTSKMYQQVTDAMIFDYKKAVTYAKITGLIMNEHRKPIVAFERVERGMHTKGHLIAMTKKQEFLFEFTGLEATFYIENELLGRFDKAGTIYDANGQTIGHAKHPVKASFDIEFFKKTHVRMGEGLFPLILNGRQLATINVAPNYDDLGHISSVSKVFDELGFGTPIITLTDSPTTTEENWLLAFAIFETAFHGNWLIP